MRRTVDDLTVEVAAIDDFDRDALALLWEKAHGNPPPKAIRNDLLARSAAWHLQAKRLSGLSTCARRLLRETMAEIKRASAKSGPTLTSSIERAVDGDAASDPRRRLQRRPPGPSGGFAASGARRGRAVPSPGARLVREWNGKNHIVDVIEGGFVFQAKVHKSLTAIAHQITGAHWSGPRFFGL